MNESKLKKEFKESDVQRVRNIVNKDFSSKTKNQTGYQKKYLTHSEGDVWEESGKTWTIKNGLKQNVTKLDNFKKSIRIPLVCPKCEGSMKHHLAKKMYKIHGFCFDCTINMEAELRKAGLYESYEKKMMQGNMKTFAKDIEQWVMDYVFRENTFVTEQGDVEDWKSNSKHDEKILSNLKSYLGHLKEHISQSIYIKIH